MIVCAIVRNNSEKKIITAKFELCNNIYTSESFFFLFTSEIENQKGRPKKRPPIIDLYGTNFEFEKDRRKVGRKRKKGQTFTEFLHHMGYLQTIRHKLVNREGFMSHTFCSYK